MIQRNLSKNRSIQSKNGVLPALPLILGIIQVLVVTLYAKLYMF